MFGTLVTGYFIFVLIDWFLINLKASSFVVLIVFFLAGYLTWQFFFSNFKKYVLFNNPVLSPSFSSSSSSFISFFSSLGRLSDKCQKDPDSPNYQRNVLHEIRNWQDGAPVLFFSILSHWFGQDQKLVGVLQMWEPPKNMALLVWFFLQFLAALSYALSLLNPMAISLYVFLPFVSMKDASGYLFVVSFVGIIATSIGVWRHPSSSFSHLSFLPSSRWSAKLYVVCMRYLSQEQQVTILYQNALKSDPSRIGNMISRREFVQRAKASESEDRNSE